MRPIRMHGLTFARLWRKKKERRERERQRKRERERNKRSHTAKSYKTFRFSVYPPTYKLYIGSKNRFEIQILKVLAAGGGEGEEKKWEKRRALVCVCARVWEGWIASPATGWQLIYMYAATFAVTSILIIRPSLLSSSEPFLLFVPVRHRKARTSSRKNRCVGRLAERFTWNYAPIKIGFSERVLLTNASADLCGINCF